MAADDFTPGSTGPPVVRNPSVSSQAGSSQFQSQSLPSRRPHGARRRGGLLAGLRIVNPDDSDEDEVEAHKRPGGPGRTASVGSGGSSSGAPVTPSESSDASSSRIPSIPATPRAPPPSAPMPTVPAPLSSPLPSLPAVPPSAPSGSSSFLVGSPNQFDGTIMSSLSPAPPTPPPRPERHLQRAFTSPSSDHVKIHPEPLRHTSAGSVQKAQTPASPPRTLPPLPSVPGSSRQSQGAVSPTSTSPSPFSAGSGSSMHHHNPLPMPPLAHGNLPPLPSSTGVSSTSSAGANRVDSPESIISPGASASSARRGSSLAEASGRHKMLLQATCDNEQFTIVDVTKATSGDAILDLVLSKMQFRDDEYDSLSLYRTDIGEAADPYPTPPADLYSFCTQYGDAKGTLKFLIKQTKIPTSSNASVIPPPGAGFEHESVRYTPNIDRRQGGSVSWAQQMELGGPRRSPSRHSKDGSMSSASEQRSRGNNGEPSSPTRYATRSIGDGHETDTSSNSRGGVKRSRVPNGRRLPSSPSRSPMGEHHPSMFEGIIHGHRSVSAAASPVIIPPSPIAHGLGHSASLELELSPGGQAESEQRYRQGSITPTPYTGQRRFASEQSSEGTSLPYLDGSSSAGLGIRNVSSGSSSRPTMSPLTIPNSSFGASATPTMDGMDQETRELILRLDAEERERERAQFEADRELALKEQQSEQEVWEAMQQLERTERERQVRADAVRAQRVEAEEREHAAQREAHDLERREYDRQVLLSQERRERRQHFQGIPRPGDADRTLEDWRDNTSGGHHSESRPAGYDPTISPSQQYQHTPSNYTYQTSPPTLHSPEGSFYPDRRRPSGVQANSSSANRAQENQHAQERLHDPRLQHVGSVPANRSGNRPTSSGPRRNTPTPRIVHPFAYIGPTGGTADAVGRSASLQAARSMDNMRPNSAMAHPYQLQPGGIHHSTRASATPAPESSRQQYYGRGRDYSPDQLMRADSPERPSSTAPGGPHASGYSATVQFPEAVPFPSPQITGSSRPWPERATSPRAEGRTPKSLHVNTRPQRRDQSLDQRDPGSSRPQTVHYDRSPPVPSSPDTQPRRPSTIYSHSPPASQAGHFESNPSSPRYYGNSPRLEPSQHSPTLATRDRRINSEGFDDRQRRTSHSSNTANDYDGHLQAAMRGLLVNNRPEDMRSMSEASTATLRGGPLPPPYISDGPTATMRAEQWLNDTATSFTAESTITDGTFRPVSSQAQPDFDDDDAEATLFIKPPSSQPSASTTLSRTPALRPTPGKLNGAIELQANSRASFLDSEGTGLGPWARPKPDVMYDNLQEFFPGVDLDKPIFDVAAAPVESPAQSPLRQDHPPMPIPRPAAATARSSFNKAENRKSIRVVADRAKSRLSKVGSMVSEGLIRRRSTAMWNHKIAEVTKIKPGEDIQVPTAIPESPAATVDEKPPADTFQWVKGRLIGSGSFGSVYIAFNVSNAEMIAVKQVAKSAAGQASAKQQGMIKALKEEMLILKDVDHVNIVRYLGFDESPEYFSMFLEYVEGGTIRTLYRTFGVLEDNMVKSFTKQLTEGLIYLHDRRVWHRDIKSENILVDNEGVVKISDFGISKKHSNNDEEQMTQTGYRGTFAWMAPEVYLSETRGDKIEYNSKIDIWSLGCLVLEMLTAQVPWSSIPGGMFGVFRAVTAGKRPSVPEGMTLAPDAYSFIYDKTVVTAPASRCEGRALLREPFLTSLDPDWRFELSSVGMAAVSAAIEQAQKLRADKV